MRPRRSAAPHARANDGASSVAAFSSTGLAYDGRVKPDLVAPGVADRDRDAGLGRRSGRPLHDRERVERGGRGRRGSSAVLAEARPLLDASALRSVLDGNRAAAAVDGAVTEEGAGLVALGAASAGELATQPTTLAFGNARAAPLAPLAGRRRPQRVVAPASRARLVRDTPKAPRSFASSRRLTSFVLQPGRDSA